MPSRFDEAINPHDSIVKHDQRKKNNGNDSFLSRAIFKLKDYANVCLHYYNNTPLLPPPYRATDIIVRTITHSLSLSLCLSFCGPHEKHVENNY